jgi:hypothetical protein
VNSYDLDSLKLLARERHQQRLREAEAERLTREIRAAGQRRRLRWTVSLALGASRLLRQRRLET